MKEGGRRAHGAVRAVVALGFFGFAASFGHSLFMLLVHGQAYVRRRGWVDVDLSDPFQWGMAGFLAIALVGSLVGLGYVLTHPNFGASPDA